MKKVCIVSNLQGVVMLAAGLMLGACREDVPPTSPPAQPTATPVVGSTELGTTTESMRQTVRELGQDLNRLGSQVGEKIEEGVDEASVAFARERDEFTAAVQGEYRDLQESIRRWRERNDASTDDGRTTETEETWEDETQELDSKMERLKEASAETWEDTKRETREALDKLRESYERTVERIKDKNDS